MTVGQSFVINAQFGQTFTNLSMSLSIFGNIHTDEPIISFLLFQDEFGKLPEESGSPST